MYVSGPPSSVVLLSDYRMAADRDLDVTEPDRAPHVLDRWHLGREVLKGTYWQTQRIALFDIDEKPSRQEVTQARRALLNHLAASPPYRVVVLPTPSAAMGEPALGTVGTLCWSMLKPPDHLEAMRLCLWDRDGVEVMPGYPIARRSKQLHVWQMGQALFRAVGAETLKPTVIRTVPGPPMVAALTMMHGKPIAVDLEFIPSLDITTAIGLSDGTVSVSVPWHPYRPAQLQVTEPGLSAYPDSQLILQHVRTLLAAATPKYCHNFVADVPRLKRLGLVVGGTVMDTFAAHAIAYPELRHGLQVAAASLLPVPPWKSLYRPTEGAWHRDDEEYYTAAPMALRDYNAKDAFYTWHLAQVILPEVGVNATTGEPLP